MTTSKRLAEKKNSAFHKNITKRGNVPDSVTKRSEKFPVSVWVLGFFIFVVIGSSLHVRTPPMCIALYVRTPPMSIALHVRTLPMCDGIFQTKW
ncbi:unnamed protein product [Closterium sp. NIES-53]